MEAVRRIDHLAEPTIHLTRDSLTVRVRGYVHREADLWALARTTVDFATLILELDPKPEISWGETSTGGGECRICGNPLETRTVRCARCQTPHHRDCWKYNGKCSIYACGGSTFTEANL